MIKGGELRTFTAIVSFVILSAVMLDSLGMFHGVVKPGVSELYNQFGPKIAPNMITNVVFDWRGYDTLGECFVMVSGVIVTALVFGRGILGGGRVDIPFQNKTDVKPTVVLELFALPLMMLVFALGFYTTLGGHITPGGGFPGGSIIAAGVLLSLVVFGRKSVVEFSEKFLINFETLGALIYILLGVAGLFFSGYFLYNTGTNLYGFVPESTAAYFNYPDGLNAGILPYLNIAVMLKVGAGLTTALLVLLGVKKWS